jgi:signal transduction histidine kinase
VTTRVIEAAQGGKVQFAVIDNGVGIHASHLARVFSHGFTTRQDGHGFGLHSAVNAAREMQGNLTASSDGPGKGSTFTLELPLAGLSTTEEMIIRRQETPCLMK